MTKEEIISTIKLENPDSPLMKVIEDVVQNIKKSEDEKTRESLINLVKKSHGQGGYALHKDEADKMIAWLEKQGKTQPTLDVEIPFGRDSELIDETMTVPYGGYAVLER